MSTYLRLYIIFTMCKWYHILYIFQDFCYILFSLSSKTYRRLPPSTEVEGFRRTGEFYEMEKLLLESIDICQSHVNNYEALAKLYFRQAKYSEAKKLLQKAMKNVVQIRTKNPSMTDVQNFLAEYIKGIFSTKDLKSLAIEACIRAKIAQDPFNIELLLQLLLVEVANFNI